MGAPIKCGKQSAALGISFGLPHRKPSKGFSRKGEKYVADHDINARPCHRLHGRCAAYPARVAVHLARPAAAGMGGDAMIEAVVLVGEIVLGVAATCAALLVAESCVKAWKGKGNQE